MSTLIPSFQQKKQKQKKAKKENEQLFFVARTPGTFSACPRKYSQIISLPFPNPVFIIPDPPFIIFHCSQRRIDSQKLKKSFLILFLGFCPPCRQCRATRLCHIGWRCAGNTVELRFANNGGFVYLFFPFKKAAPPPTHAML